MSRLFRPLLALLVATTALGAQPREGREPRGGSAVSMAVSLWNASATRRVSGPLDVAQGEEITGDVAVLNGPVNITGRITGSLVAINADVRLQPGARIGRNLIVIGGSITGRDSAVVEGEVRTQAELLRYHLEEDKLVPEDDPFYDPRSWGRRERITESSENYVDPLFMAAETYNRVEGLPVKIGPRFRRTTDWGRIQVDALGIVRTAEPVRWDRGTIGHDFRAEVRLGKKNGLLVAGRAFDVIAPVERWQLTDKEAGLASFVLRRDMRDHYGRHGAEASLGARLGEEVSLVVALGNEQWRGVNARNPFTLFRDNERWQSNPSLDAADVDLASVRFLIDTRDRVRSPWLGGWYVQADLERGEGTIARDPGRLTVIPTSTPLSYTRGFLDARRYTRIAPNTALNLRFVMGGWLGGDELPLQRRVSVGGPGSIEGYDHRRAWRDTDVFSCGGIAERDGRPANCDRIALAQVEVRQDFDADWARSDRDDHWWHPGFNTRGAWVLFADAGRGWTIDRGLGGIRQSSGVPPLSTFRTSIGGGLDFGSLGIYLAKAVSTADEPVNVIVRLGRRF